MLDRSKDGGQVHKVHLEMGLHTVQTPTQKSVTVQNQQGPGKGGPTLQERSRVDNPESRPPYEVKVFSKPYDNSDFSENSLWTKQLKV